MEKYKLNIFNDNALKVELFVNYQLSQYQNLTTQQVILEKIQSQLPNIASGKIKLPTTPELSKKPEVSISTSIEQSKGKGLDL